MSDVYITRTGSFLPFDPVSNDDMEDVLGKVAGQPSRARRTILRSNGIQSRHYAIDRRTGELALTNTQLTAHAVRALGEVSDVDVLACGTTFPDQLAPGHAVMVHGELGWPRLEATSCAGICVSSIAAMKHAWLSVKAGGARRAVATGSELFSPHLLSRRFEAESQHKIDALEKHPEIAFEKDFLRWMLSDGAGAVLLDREPGIGGISLRVEWIELSSAAHKLPVCMYAGGDKDGSEGLRGWTAYSSDDWKSKSIFSLKQDVRLLNENITNATLVEPLKELIKKHALKSGDVDWFLPHLSSHYFFPHMRKSLIELDLNIPEDRWFTNLRTKGNTGAASPYIMLDELVRSGRVSSGQKILMFAPESGRFSSGFVYLTAV